MHVIVNADKNWGIGLKNSLLVRIPSDMKYFREHTIGKVIVMGRKTLESFPQGQPLAGRTNIVITTNKAYKVNGAVVVHSFEQLENELSKYDEDDIYIIGGGSIYEQFLPKCKVAHVTKVNHAYEADTYFPNLEENGEWKLVEESEEQTYFDLEYTFNRYERII